jgi:hypothetical protein
MPNKPEILTVTEFRKLKGTVKKPIIVYFNEKQWANLTRNLKPLKGKPPKKTMTLTLSELPGIPGGFGAFLCPTVCPKPIFENGLGRCECPAPDLTPGGGGSVAAPRKFCFMWVRGDGTVKCSGRCSESGRSCSLGAWRVSGSSVIILTCDCR